MLRLCLCVEMCQHTYSRTQNVNITLDVVLYFITLFVCRAVSVHVLSNMKWQYYVRRGAIFASDGGSVGGAGGPTGHQQNNYKYNAVGVSSCVCTVLSNTKWQYFIRRIAIIASSRRFCYYFIRRVPIIVFGVEEALCFI